MKNILLFFALFVFCGCFNFNENFVKALNTKDTYILKELSNCKEKVIRECIANNLNTPKHLLVKLAKDNDLWVKVAVAGNPNTPLKTLNSLLELNDLNINYAIAGNFASSQNILLKILKCSDIETKTIIASRRYLVKNVLEELLRVGNNKIRFIALNHNSNRNAYNKIDKSLRKKLTLMKSEKVLSLLLIIEQDKILKNNVIRNKYTPVDVLTNYLYSQKNDKKITKIKNKGIEASKVYFEIIKTLLIKKLEKAKIPKDKIKRIYDKTYQNTYKQLSIISQKISLLYAFRPKYPNVSAFLNKNCCIKSTGWATPSYYWKQDFNKNYLNLYFIDIDNKKYFDFPFYFFDLTNKKGYEEFKTMKIIFNNILKS